MTRSAALRAGSIFILLTFFFAALGTSSYSPVAEALTLIAGSLSAVMLLFAFATPAHAAVSARIRRFR
jgi:hypothetical protein